MSISDELTTLICILMTMGILINFLLQRMHTIVVFVSESVHMRWVGVNDMDTAQ